MNEHEEEDDKAHLHMSLEMISKLDSKLTWSLEMTANVDSILASMKINRNAFGSTTFKITEYGKKERTRHSIIF